MFKQDFRGWRKDILGIMDSGYQGVLEIHGNSITPKKRSKNHKLSKEQKSFNSELSSERIYIEHINAWIKRFKILTYPYRNRRKRHGLRMNLICGIYNYEKLTK